MEKRPTFLEDPVPVTKKIVDGTTHITLGDTDTKDLSHLEENGVPSDKLMIRSPKDWYWNTLPMKNRKERTSMGMPAVGVMREGDERTIYNQDKEMTVKAQFKDIDELLAAGWVVD